MQNQCKDVSRCEFVRGGAQFDTNMRLQVEKIQHTERRDKRGTGGDKQKEQESLVSSEFVLVMGVMAL